MRPTEIPEITKADSGYYITCRCGWQCFSKFKNTIIKIYKRGNCRRCVTDYRSVKDNLSKVRRNSEGRWCSSCPSCGCEQAYTRKDHARQSSASGWRCRKCCAHEKSFTNNAPVGPVRRMFNKYKRSACKRGISWSISFEEFDKSCKNICALSGWPLSYNNQKTTASLDRIDSSKPYSIDNVQWVHTMVNMCKNKYPQEMFIQMCRDISNKFPETK